MKGRIFVSVPSFRDSECENTIFDLLSKADFPNLIDLGVCLQLNAQDDQCLIKSRHNQSIVYISDERATGPFYARFLTLELFKGQEYVFFIDSHMRFEKGWDTFYKNEINSLPLKSVLSSYPGAYILPNIIVPDTETKILKPDHFDSDDMLRIVGVSTSIDHPTPCNFWASGLSFSRSDIISVLPFSSEFPFLFFGEELLVSVMLYTHGYICFAPSKNVAYHLWQRNYRPQLQIDLKLRKFSQERLKYLLVDYQNESKFWGNEKTIKQFEQLTNLEFSSCSVVSIDTTL